MLRLIGAVLARNEAERYLPRVLRNLRDFCDAVVLLDDGSTDDTRGVCQRLGVEWVPREAEGPMWGQESPARQQLWALGAERAGSGWLYIADADHLTVGDLPQLVNSRDVNCWGLRLYDVWNEAETLYRKDGFWRAHEFPRPWLFRPSACPDPQWPERGVHTGHCPLNFPGPMAVAPDDMYIVHLGYAKALDREAKRAQYRNTPGLTPFERAHADSI